MMDHPEEGTGKITPLPPRSMRTAVILPDGTKPVPLGSGTITALLGEGGMANVYEIWNSQLEVPRAVKLVHPNCSEEAKQRFQTEIKITAKLHHPNIIEIHGVGEWNALPFIEMEKIQGVTLEDLINERGALPLTAATAIGIMISRALSFAHNQEYVIYGRKYHGVIHRDLKPSNIMVCHDGTVKLMDFGIARPTDASIHTTDGSVLGTLQYLSPEQLDGKELDVRTDVYSLGTTLYEVLTGVKAFPERNVSRLMMDKIRNRFKPLEDYAAKFPQRLRRLIHKCMLHDREKRLRTAGLLLTELERVHRSLTIDTPEQVIRRILNTSGPGKTVLSTHRRFPVGLVAAAALVIGAAAFSSMTLLESLRDKPAEPRAAKAGERTPAPVVTEQDGTKPEPEAPDKPTDTPATSTRTSRPVRRVASGASSPAPAPPPKPSPPTSFVDKIKERHGTDDLLAILGKEVRAGNYTTALRLHHHLSGEEARSAKAAIYKLRALQGMGATGKLASFLAATPVDDGEIHLARAKLAFDRGDYARTRDCLRKSLSSPRAFMDYEQLKREAHYYQALCATAAFDAAPSESTYKAALDAWYQVRSALRGDPGHRYNQRARSETQRIGETFRDMEG